MSQEYCRGVLRVCVAQICQHFGWNSIHSTPLELLTDVLERYLLQLGKVTNRYSEQFGRTDPRLEDLQLAFGHMGIRLEELEDYVRHVEPLPFAQEVVSFPQPQPVDLKFPNPDSKEVQQRKVFEFVPEHLPYMHPELNEEIEDPIPPMPSSPERLQVVDNQVVEMSPGSQGEKRSISSPGDPGLPFKRPRMTASNLPEEASHSQYEMQSVVMTNSGILSPLREGKLPDTKTPPTGPKRQIVIVKKGAPGVAATTQGGKLPSDTPIIKLDFSKDTTGTGKIVQVTGMPGVDDSTNDPDFSVKKKKVNKKSNVKEVKKKKLGRPKSPGRVVHKIGSAADLASSLLKPRKDDSGTGPGFGAQSSPVDLTLKPTPPPPNISVKVEEGAKHKQDTGHKTVEYRPKVTVMSKQQEQDMEDTIASVIERSSKEMEMKEMMELEEKRQKEAAYKSSLEKDKKEKLQAEAKEKEDTWRVKSFSETYDGNANDSFESDSRGEEDIFSSTDSAQPEFEFPYHKPQYTAPHLALLNASPRPRGRPRGSTSAFYKTLNIRSPHGRKPGRPPLSRSPGRPSYMSRSPGRPPLNRSPGRPPISGRSPGRPPGSARSPGRPKGSLSSNASPKPRGRPRGSKSPRGRGMSTREPSPKAIININFDENTSSSVESRKVPKEDANDSDATLFEFPSQSPDNRDSPSPDRAPREGSIEKLKSKKDIKATGKRHEQVSPVRERQRDVTPPSKEKADDSVKSERERDTFKDRDTREFVRDLKESISDFPKEPSWERDIKQESSEEGTFSREMSIEPKLKELKRDKESADREREDSARGTDLKEHSRERDIKETSLEREKESRERDRSKEHKKDKKKKKKKDKDKEKDRDRDKDKEKKEKHKKEKEKEPKEASPSVAPLQKLKIKFGGGSTSTSFRITSAQPTVTPKREPASPPPPAAAAAAPPRPEILKLKLFLPKKTEKSSPSEQSWVSSIKKEQTLSPKIEDVPPLPSPKPSSPISTQPPSQPPITDVDTETSKLDASDNDQASNKDGDEEVTVSVVKGKIVTVKKATKVKKRRGSSKKARPKTGKLLAAELLKETVLGKFESTPSPPATLTVQNVPSPITIPALKAAPPPPSPPTAKKSPPKPKSVAKESRPYSPLFKEAISKPKPPPVQIPKPSGKTPKTSPRRSSPRKSPKISPPSKKKNISSLFPNFPSTPSSASSQSIISDVAPPRTPSPSNVHSPSESAKSSPMYSPASSPPRDSPPLSFTIPPTPAFPTRTHSPPPSPIARQLSTDDEKESTPPVEKTKMLPPSLPPMPPSSAMRKAQRTVVAETVGSFVNESGERIWICPSCTLQDDGSPMIGCDVCDDWYHWPCVSITEEPDEEEQWYCPKCVKPVAKTGKAKRGRKKKKP